MRVLMLSLLVACPTGPTTNDGTMPTGDSGATDTTEDKKDTSPTGDSGETKPDPQTIGICHHRRLCGYGGEFNRGQP